MSTYLNHLCPRLSISVEKLNITVVLEFYPDNASEPESPLDDIRKMIQAT
ncbi:KGK domain-containing protein [uncultured Nostoc sp.]|nr:KGK domain-containing protein [uncultured Nostoc sp.]